MYEKRDKKYGEYRPPKGFIKLDRETSIGIRHLRRDVETGGRWLAGKAKKEYGKFKTLRGARIYEFVDGDFIRYTVVFQDGSMYAMSANPMSPMGYREHLGNIREDKSLKPFGKKITLDMVPWEVRRTIKKISVGAL